MCEHDKFSCKESIKAIQGIVNTLETTEHASSNIHKDDSTNKEMDEIKEELKTLNTELTVLKHTVKYLNNIRTETLVMVKVISELKEDILNIKDENPKQLKNW